MNQYVKPLFDKCKDYLDPEFTEENFDKNTEEHRKNISKAKTGVKREPMKEEQKETLSKLWKCKHWRTVNGKREWY